MHCDGELFVVGEMFDSSTVVGERRKFVNVGEQEVGDVEEEEEKEEEDVVVVVVV